MYSIWHSDRQVHPLTCRIVQYMVQRQAGHTGTGSYMYNCTVNGTPTGRSYRYSLIHVQLYRRGYSDRQVIQVQPQYSLCTVYGTATGRYSLIHVKLHSTRYSDRQVIQVQLTLHVQLYSTSLQRQAGHMSTASCSSRMATCYYRCIIFSYCIQELVHLASHSQKVSHTVRYSS
jgi:hypothetical protein